MAKINGTNQDLFAAHMELQELQKHQPMLAHFVGGRIESFYKNNSVKIQALSDKQKAIWDKYVELEDDGKTYKVTKEGVKSFIKPSIELGEIELKAYLDRQAENMQKELDKVYKQGVTFII